MSIDLLDVAPATMSDAALMDAADSLGETRRRIDALLSAIAAELADRSRPELGHKGLAQSRGARTPERLIQQLTGVTKSEAHTLVRVGEITAPSTPDSSPDLPSWLGAVGAAVREGRLTISAADAIRSGLGSPREGVPAEALARAAATLVLLAATLTVEQLAIHARHARDELDEAGIAERAALLRERRYLHISLRPDGMTRLSGLLDPESAAIVTAAYDGVTSPRRGGPRFVDAEALAQAERLKDDPRTVDQIAVDSFVELVRVGAAADPTRILPVRRPEVVVHVTLRDLDRRVGRGRLEGQSATLAIPSVERQICEAGALPILFDGKRVVDIGRTQRLFTQRQRLALAARDAGCRFPRCERPPSWCEAHHLKPWSHGGGTAVDNGVLLCRHHHLLVHDAGWTARREPDGGYTFDPPPGVRGGVLVRGGVPVRSSRPESHHE